MLYTTKKLGFAPPLDHNSNQIFTSLISLFSIDQEKFSKHVKDIYNNSLESLENELKLKNSKIMLWVNKHKFKFVEFDIDQEKNFFNINTQDDLNNAKKINI